MNVTVLTHQARALYESGVVPVLVVTQLCGVSLRTLYHHVHKQGWRRRRSSVPRDLAKSERQRRRYRALKALQPAAPGGLKARDPQGAARAAWACERFGLLAGEALARAQALDEAEAHARVFAIVVRAMRDLDAIAMGEPGRGRLRPRGQGASARKGKAATGRRGYVWKPMRVS